MDELHQIPLFEGISDDEFVWLLDNSYELYLDNGDYLTQEGEEVDLFCVVLNGELQVTATINGRQSALGTLPRGVIGGELQLLNRTPSFVAVRAIMPAHLMVLTADVFRQLFTVSPKIGARILQIAAERAQRFSVTLSQQEKMAALGKLSAGLAHELNNPAAAARRAAQTLRDSTPSLQTRMVKLALLGLSNEQLEKLIAFQQETVSRVADTLPLSPLAQSDREDEIADWLDEHGVEDHWDMTSTFVSMGVTLDDLKALAATVPLESLGDILAWLHEILCATLLLDEIEQSTRRISELVGAIKAYTYMDQAAQQEVDIHRGLENTLTVLNYKLKNIKVVRDYAPDLPLIMARGGELNQVWTNLIDNAIDAIAGEGTIWISTRSENNFIMVEVTDNGPGIAREILPRLFEPFFTTKEVGAGSGLGLDIAYRIIKQHKGVIEVQSEPGRTRFIVRLPIAVVEQPDTEGALS
jgi:signal transduction histidine kinase